MQRSALAAGGKQPTPYAQAAFDYLRAGWRGVLPLPSHRKKDPPAGYTGRAGAWPDPVAIQAWIDFDPHLGNIALRPPETVVGLDADMYDGKAGAATLANLQAELGALPLTVMSTSRTDGSGIRWYRVPYRPTWRDPGPGIEIIHYGWRYAVVAPSIHPDGRTYVWIDQTTGEILEALPSPDHLPDLPAAWVDRLSSNEHIDKASVTNPDVVSWLDALPAGPPCKAAANTVDDFIAKLADAVSSGASRHDAAAPASARIVRVGEMGHHGVRDALAVARGRFLAAVTDDRPGGEQEAVAEWRRLVAGAVAIVTADPTPDDDRRCGCTPTLVELPPSTPPADERSSWEAIDPTGLLDGTYQPPQPTQLTTTDGAALFYEGQTNAVYGESESGKSWVAVFASAQALDRGEHVVYIDFEADAPIVYDRLHKLGATLDALRTRFAYIRPEDPLDRPVLTGVLDRHRPTLVVLDGITDAMGLHGLNPLDNTDAQKFDKMLPRWIANRGPAVAQIDHLSQAAAKDPTSKYGLGAQHKRAALSGAGYRLDVVRQLAPGDHGFGKLTITKDRHGVIRGRNPATKIAAEFHLDATNPSRLVAELRPAEANVDEQGEFRPTVLMQRVSMVLEKTPDGLTTNKLVEAVTGKKPYVMAAIAKLIEEGFVATEDGPRNATIHRSVRPFTSDNVERPGPATGTQSTQPTEAPGPTESQGRDPVPGPSGNSDWGTESQGLQGPGTGPSQLDQSGPPSTNGDRHPHPRAVGSRMTTDDEIEETPA